MASTAQARGSWKGEMKTGSWLFNLVANRSKWGTSQNWNIWDRVPLWIVHSVWIICPFLDSQSARTFSFPGTNLAVRDTCLFIHHSNRLVAMKDRVRDRAPPFFVQISHYSRIVCWQQNMTFRNYLTEGFQSQHDCSEFQDIYVLSLPIGRP